MFDQIYAYSYTESEFLSCCSKQNKKMTPPPKTNTKKHHHHPPKLNISLSSFQTYCESRRLSALHSVGSSTGSAKGPSGKILQI